MVSWIICVETFMDVTYVGEYDGYSKLRLKEKHILSDRVLVLWTFSFANLKKSCVRMQ